MPGSWNHIVLGAQAEAPRLMREVFGNIPGWSKALFYLVAAVSLTVFLLGCYRRIRRWKMGRPSHQPDSILDRFVRFGRDVILQRRVGGRGLASLGHALLFSGFVVLLIGTTLIAVEHLLASALGRPASNPVFHRGAYYAIYEIVMDTFGLFFLVGVVILAKRPHCRPVSR